MLVQVPNLHHRWAYTSPLSDDNTAFVIDGRAEGRSAMEKSKSRRPEGRIGGAGGFGPTIQRPPPTRVLTTTAGPHVGPSRRYRSHIFSVNDRIGWELIESDSRV